MANLVSNDHDFQLNRDQIITRALRLLGVISAGQSPTTSEVSDASDVLNLMLKAWGADGLHLWTRRRIQITTTQGDSSYSIGDSDITDVDTTVDVHTSSGKPLEILHIHRRETATSIDTPMNQMSLEDYERLSDKDSEGTPTNWVYDPKRMHGWLYIWPAPDANFAANYTLNCWFSSHIHDMDSATNTLYAPQEWHLAIVWGLAVLLAPEYGVSINDQQLLQQTAAIEKDRVMGWDMEKPAVFFTPEYNRA
jgi:hypothetical protein